MSLIVQKFGSCLLESNTTIVNTAKRVVDAYNEGNSVVVVVSASSGLIGELVGKAKGLNLYPSKREMDVLLSTGEQASAALLAMAIESEEYPVISLTGQQAGIISDSNYGAARIKTIDTERIFRELDRKNIVIVAGSQAWNKFDDITTLGDRGADVTAVALTAALKADLCEIYAGIDGIYTADPKIVQNAKKLNDISYDEMLELASLGTNILSNRAVEMARKYNVNLVIRSGEENEPGTIVKEVGSVEKMLVRGVTRDNGIARIAVMGIEDKPGMAYKLFSLLAKEKIAVDLIIQSIGTDNAKDISFTIAKENLDKTLEIINNNLQLLGAKEVKHSDRYSKVSVVGAGIVNNPAVASMMFEALYDANINIHMIATSEIKISVLVDIQDADMAVSAVHEKFRLSELIG